MRQNVFLYILKSNNEIIEIITKKIQKNYKDISNIIKNNITLQTKTFIYTRNMNHVSSDYKS